MLQFISFALSSNIVNFGNISSVQTRYASSTGLGDGSETEAFNVKVNTNAPTGYYVTVQGATLTSGVNTISALGTTNTLPSVGSEQFGMRVTVSGSNGVVASRYSGTGFAYAGTATTTDIIGSASVGDSATSTYSVRLMTNVAISTEAGDYTTSLVYVATANF
jgi:hypothetical protein